MSYSFWVLAARDALPDPAQIAAVLAKARLPLRFGEPWSWADQQGWLPARWRKAESGFELDLEPLDRKEAAAAERAGHPRYDTGIVVTMRGADSIQAGLAFGAALAVACGGCITEAEYEYVPHTDALRWARKGIADSVKQEKLDAEREQAVAEARAAGGVEAQLEAALAAMGGQKVTQFVAMMGQLGVLLAGGQRLSGSSWRVTARDGQRHDQSRYATLRSRQFAILAAGEQTPERLQEMQALEAQLADAEALDGKDGTAAQRELGTWPRGTVLQAASWQRPGVIRLQFEGGMQIEFVGGTFGEISCHVPPLRYNITGEGPALA
jgi:hypothetical protein